VVRRLGGITSAATQPGIVDLCGRPERPSEADGRRRPSCYNDAAQRANRNRRTLQAERAYQRLVADWQAAGRGRAGAGAAVGRASDGLSLSPAARQTGKPQASVL